MWGGGPPPLYKKGENLYLVIFCFNFILVFSYVAYYYKTNFYHPFSLREVIPPPGGAALSTSFWGLIFFYW